MLDQDASQPDPQMNLLTKRTGIARAQCPRHDLGLARFNGQRQFPLRPKATVAASAGVFAVDCDRLGILVVDAQRKIKIRARRQACWNDRVKPNPVDRRPIPFAGHLIHADSQHRDADEQSSNADPFAIHRSASQPQVTVKAWFCLNANCSKGTGILLVVSVSAAKTTNYKPKSRRKSTTSSR